MQQQQQRVLLGNAPLSTAQKALTLALAGSVIFAATVVFVGADLSLFKGDYRGRSGIAQLLTWGVGLALIVPTLLLTRRQLVIELSGPRLRVEEGERVLWEGVCTGWRWRKLDAKSFLGIELLSGTEEPFLIRTGAIATGHNTPYLPLANALSQAKIPEEEVCTQPEPFRTDISSWLGLGILVALALAVIVFVVLCTPRP